MNALIVSVKNRGIPAIGMAGIVAHLTATALDNLPDQHLSLARLSSVFGHLPAWRFFGPNPGVEDMHLLVRHGELPNNLGLWEEVDNTVERPWWSLLWNPGTRGPKTLFDVCQQITRMSMLTHGDFDAVSKSETYEMLRDYVSEQVPNGHHFQFTLMSARPGPVNSEAHRCGNI